MDQLCSKRSLPYAEGERNALGHGCEDLLRLVAKGLGQERDWFQARRNFFPSKEPHRYLASGANPKEPPASLFICFGRQRIKKAKMKEPSNQ
jgi:hypothetical protein